MINTQAEQRPRYHEVPRRRLLKRDVLQFYQLTILQRAQPAKTRTNVRWCYASLDTDGFLPIDE